MNPAPQAILADRVFDGRRWHERAAVLIADGRVGGVAAQVPADWPAKKLPAGAILAPGFVDLQVNGGGGVLLNDLPTIDGFRAIARAHRRFGTTALLPTLITDTREKMRVAITAAATAAGHDGVLGMHLEGPFLNPARKGAHRADLIVSATDADLELLLGLRGPALVTLAPECVPAGFVRALTQKGNRVAAGHSEASAEQMMRAADDGLTGVTHLFNAMPPLQSREPGIVGIALADPRFTAGLIVDGLHVDPVTVRAAFAAKGAAGIALISDAMPTVGSDRKHFDLMGRRIALHDGKLTTDDGTLAGAHLDMASAVRNAVKFGIALETALQAASLTPARFLGIDSERGVLAPGAHADLVALDSNLNVIATWVAGEEEFYS
jgi:N-acetylglucosamine-6-phosphate deacetylase